MSRDASVTMWINAVRQGDASAAEHLWRRYFQQLMAQARLRMTNVDRSGYDEEDAAISTFHILCTKLQEGHYASLSDRDELWQLMLTVLIRKVGRRVKYQQASKRSTARTGQVGFSVDELPAATSDEISEECFELIALLNDSNLEQVALLKFEGYTNEEIAAKLNRTRRTIQRMLNLIRSLWQEALDRDQSTE